MVQYTSESPDEVLSFLAAQPNPLPSYIAYDRSCSLLAHVIGNPALHSWLDHTKLIVDAWHFAGHSKGDELCGQMCDPAPKDGRSMDLLVPMVDPSKPRHTRRVKKEEDEDEKEGVRRNKAFYLRQLCLEDEVKSEQDASSAPPRQRVFRRAFNTEVSKSWACLLTRSSVLTVLCVRTRLQAAEQLNSWLGGFGPILRHLRADNFDFLVHVLLRKRFESRQAALSKKYGISRVG